MRDYLLQFNVNLYPNTQFNNGFARVKESATGFMMIKRECVYYYHAKVSSS
jgi:hypothetical protein